MEALLVIVTLILVLVTGFFTYNLSRIELFDKRYKIYESLIRFLAILNNLNQLRLSGALKLQYVLDPIKDQSKDTIESYKRLIGGRI